MANATGSISRQLNPAELRIVVNDNQQEFDSRKTQVMRLSDNWQYTKLAELAMTIIGFNVLFVGCVAVEEIIRITTGNGTEVTDLKTNSFFLGAYYSFSFSNTIQLIVALVSMCRPCGKPIVRQTACDAKVNCSPLAYFAWVGVVTNFVLMVLGFMSISGKDTTSFTASDLVIHGFSIVSTFNLLFMIATAAASTTNCANTPLRRVVCLTNKKQGDDLEMR
ncbi:MAG: hypothetical protein S4CHLAM20_13540 [Chlamydiia bacterium]|nr:hypothetical protein [Chlamydiia bacterium]